ncbi:MAG: hypothetical protein JWO82_4068, partial [Akkermansiaceae bacterium]|nr:hypothetical protein [Akkermansiaceae bacterium]
EKPFHFDRIVIHEYADMKELGDGFSQQRSFRTQAYTIDAFQDGKWTTIHTGETIGAAKIITLPEKITAEKLRLHITAASQPPSICHLSVSDSGTTHLRGTR